MRILSLTATALVLAACFSGYRDDGAGGLVVRRGTFTSDVVLTGELEAARGAAITVPSLPNWQTSIKWLSDDGVKVRQGDRVVELDNTTFVSDLDSKRQAELQALQEYQQRTEEWKADLKQKQLDFEKRKSELEKTKIDADIPRDIVSAREYEERQMAHQRAMTEYQKARDVLAAQERAVAADRKNLEIRLGKAQREIRRSEQAIADVELRAPRDGIVVIRDIPWEGRKLEAGDTVFVGMPLALIPELDSLQVSVALPDVDDGRIAVGMPATITLDGYSGLEFKGRVTNISAVAHESARQSLRRAFKVVVALDVIDAERMRPGLSARVLIHHQPQPGMLVAPRAALDFSSAEPVAWLASGRKVKVQIGRCNAQECVVTGGLEEGQRLAAIQGGARG
ncbi:MAG TPA: HlyD family efflux transporter periplasmic adaptor subunit [Thermoanaerobaculia bacterium]|nr:HlyD family efflux transporter periplasmic adaptor subunit [Thermoanaerobaculia bacterium]